MLGGGGDAGLPGNRGERGQEALKRVVQVGGEGLLVHARSLTVTFGQVETLDGQALVAGILEGPAPGFGQG